MRGHFLLRVLAKKDVGYWRMDCNVVGNPISKTPGELGVHVQLATKSEGVDRLGQSTLYARPNELLATVIMEVALPSEIFDHAKSSLVRCDASDQKARPFLTAKTFMSNADFVLSGEHVTVAFGVDHHSGGWKLRSKVAPREA